MRPLFRAVTAPDTSVCTFLIFSSEVSLCMGNRIIFSSIQFASGVASSSLKIPLSSFTNQCTSFPDNAWIPRYRQAAMIFFGSLKITGYSQKVCFSASSPGMTPPKLYFFSLSYFLRSSTGFIWVRRE